jgi:lysophospholipase
MTLVSIPANPVPENTVAGMLKTKDGVGLRFARFAPPAGRKGTVCLFQGRAEFIEKYFETVRDLRSRGFAVATLDWRGQGGSQRALSDPYKGHVRDFAEYELDVEAFMREIVLPDCPPPHYAMAHSMGASVLLRLAYKGQRWFDRMVMSAPMIGLSTKTYPRFAKPVMKTMRMVGMGSSYIPGGDATVMAAQRFIGNPVTTDPVRHARTVAILEAKPTLGIGAPTVGWAAAAFDAMDQFGGQRFTANLRQPMVLVAAGRDVIVSTLATEEFGLRLRTGAHLIVNGAKHELLMEQDRYRSQFLAAFDAFVPGTPLFA